MTDDAYKWTTADDAVSIEIAEDEEGAPQVIVGDEETEVVVAVDVAGIDEVIVLLQKARAELVKLEAEEATEESDEDDAEEETEENE